MSSSRELHVNPEYPEELPYRKILDHGFVALIDVMGTDASIVQAARVSYGKGTTTMRSDKALIGYLMRHAHNTPLEMVEFKFLMRIPLFIARQVIRHRTASVNEYSARYSVVPDRFFVPPLGAISSQDRVNRQGRTDLLRELVEQVPERDDPCAYLSGEKAILVNEEGVGISRAALLVHEHRAVFAGTPEALPSETYVECAERLLGFFPQRKAEIEGLQALYRENNERCYALYQQFLEQGVAREIARCVLPLSMYTEWYWKIDLHNLLHFLRLRMDSHAQLEVRALAEAMATFVKPQVPFAWEAFEENRVRGTFLSAQEMNALRPVDDVTQREVLVGLFERGFQRLRLKEFCRKVDIDERIVDELWPPGTKQ
ncbi:MAG: FAD-dependent thymidylate synthase [Planctomycetota bacterium]